MKVSTAYIFAAICMTAAVCAANSAVENSGGEDSGENTPSSESVLQRTVIYEPLPQSPNYRKLYMVFLRDESIIILKDYSQ